MDSPLNEDSSAEFSRVDIETSKHLSDKDVSLAKDLFDQDTVLADMYSDDVNTAQKLSPFDDDNATRFQDEERESAIG